MIETWADVVILFTQNGWRVDKKPKDGLPSLINTGKGVPRGRKLCLTCGKWRWRKKDFTLNVMRCTKCELQKVYEGARYAEN